MKESGSGKEIEGDDVENASNEDGSLDHTRIKTPSWKEQITLRGLVASVVIGTLYSIIAMKLNLTTGIVPNLNVSAALLAFVFMRTWTSLLRMFGVVTAPFTAQENTMIQTSAVACYGIALGGGFGSYLLALSRMESELAGVSRAGNSPGSYKEPAFGWMTAYLFLVCFIGIFVLVPLRKIMIVDYNLVYPSGTATSVLINGFHATGDHTAKKQVRGFAKYFSLSFCWGLFQWFYIGKGACGFSKFPTFGLRAKEQTFYFDFSLTFVGTGMICPHQVNLSLLLGAVVSWGFMWPVINNFEGKWFPRDLPESSMDGLNGYKTFIPVALILGDGLYNSVKITYIMVSTLRASLEAAADPNNKREVLKEEQEKNEIFKRDGIPTIAALVGYVVLAVVSAVAVPSMFPEMKWYWVVVAYIIAPCLAFCNAYGAGLTDMNMAYNYGKVALFILAAMAGKESGVVAGLVGCGLIKSVVSVACTLMQDMKTAHLTNTSPRSMFLGQAAGTAVGCVVAPLTFLLFYRAFDVGNPNGEFKAPFGIIYRNIAIVGVQGLSALPRHCLQICCGFFALAIGMNVVKDAIGGRVGKWMPLPVAMAVPFLVGAYFTIDMCMGTLLVFLMKTINVTRAHVMIPAVASGLICGEGLWVLPASLLALAKINAPICMKFVPA